MCCSSGSGLDRIPPLRCGSTQRLWFGDAAAPELTPQTDELIRERFGSADALPPSGASSTRWESSPRRRLALILLLDQFARNVYRGTARAFAQEHAALALTVSGMQFGADAALDPFERLFFYRPLMHAEALEVQEESVAASRRLLEEAPESCALLRAQPAAGSTAPRHHRALRTLPPSQRRAGPRQRPRGARVARR